MHMQSHHNLHCWKFILKNWSSSQNLADDNFSYAFTNTLSRIVCPFKSNWFPDFPRSVRTNTFGSVCVLTGGKYFCWGHFFLNLKLPISLISPKLVQILNANIELVGFSRSCITRQSVPEFFWHHGCQAFISRLLQPKKRQFNAFQWPFFIKNSKLRLMGGRKRKSNQFQLISVGLRLL